MSSILPHPEMARRAALLGPSPMDEFLGAADRGATISLAGGLPDAATFPVRDAAEAARRVLSRQPRESLQYGPSEGLAPLREWVAEYLRGQGIELQAAQVLITTGSQQALDLLGKVLLDPASPLLVQRPTYLGALQAFRTYAPRMVGLPEDDLGPDPEAFAGALAGSRMAYLQPRFANPSGRSIAPARAGQLCALLAQSDCWLVEDDPYCELWFDEPPPPGLLARGVSHGVHVGTFSKMLFPGLRLGWVAGHAELLRKLTQAKQAADLQSSSLDQWLLLELLRDGLPQRMLPRLRILYRERRDAMLDALSRHMPAGVFWSRPRGGMFVWLSLPMSLDARDIAAAARRQGVLVLPGLVFDVGAGGCESFGSCCDCRFADDPEAAAPARNTLRLAFAGADRPRIERAISILAAVVRAALHGDSQAPARPCRAVGKTPADGAVDVSHA